MKETPACEVTKRYAETLRLPGARALWKTAKRNSRQRRLRRLRQCFTATRPPGRKQRAAQRRYARTKRSDHAAR